MACWVSRCGRSSFGMGLSGRVEFTGEVNKVLRTEFVPPTAASTDAPDKVRCRLDDSIRNDAVTGLGEVPILSSNRARGVGGGAIGFEGGGCGCDIGG